MSGRGAVPEDSVARFREMGDGFCLAKSLIVANALTSHEMGDHEQARVLGDQGLALLREGGCPGSELAPRLGQLGAGRRWRTVMWHETRDSSSRIWRCTRKPTISRVSLHREGRPEGCASMTGRRGLTKWKVLRGEHSHLSIGGQPAAWVVTGPV